MNSVNRLELQPVMLVVNQYNLDNNLLLAEVEAVVVAEEDIVLDVHTYIEIIILKMEHFLDLANRSGSVKIGVFVEKMEHNHDTVQILQHVSDYKQILILYFMTDQAEIENKINMVRAFMLLNNVERYIFASETLIPSKEGLNPHEDKHAKDGCCHTQPIFWS